MSSMSQWCCGWYPVFRSSSSTRTMTARASAKSVGATSRTVKPRRVSMGGTTTRLDELKVDIGRLLRLELQRAVDPIVLQRVRRETVHPPAGADDLVRVHDVRD